MMSNMQDNATKNEEGTPESFEEGCNRRFKQKQRSAPEIQNNPKRAPICLKAFDYGSTAVRTIEKDGQVWFVAADVCSALGVVNVTDALNKLDADEVALALTEGKRGARKANIISESGVFCLILRSDKAEAKVFRRWVTGVVLPAIRHTGSYGDTTHRSQDRVQSSPPAPGSYKALVATDGKVTFLSAEHEDAVDSIYFAEGRVMAHTLKLIHAHWSIVENTRRFEEHPEELYGIGPLKAAIAEGSRLAAAFLPSWEKVQEPRS